MLFPSEKTGNSIFSSIKQIYCWIIIQILIFSLTLQPQKSKTDGLVNKIIFRT
ncbi:hypothetical protein SAMN05216518_12534 [Bacteroidales bacterium KHT7]|nr:hypothetical protein SAMN05216518_12534 [Bacteroidales bacterium KHT7]